MRKPLQCAKPWRAGRAALRRGGGDARLLSPPRWGSPPPWAARPDRRGGGGASRACDRGCCDLRREGGAWGTDVVLTRARLHPAGGQLCCCMCGHKHAVCSPSAALSTQAAAVVAAVEKEDQARAASVACADSSRATREEHDSCMSPLLHETWREVAEIVGWHSCNLLDE